MKNGVTTMSCLAFCIVMLFSCKKEEISAEKTKSENQTKKTGEEKAIHACTQPAYYANCVKQIVMDETITYGPSGKYKAYAQIFYCMTPLPDCPSKYYPAIFIRVDCSRRNALGKWVDDNREVSFSHGYTKNYPQIGTYDTPPPTSPYPGFIFDGNAMSKTANCIHFTYAQLFYMFETNNYTDIFRLQNYWAHISISGGESGASIDFGPFM